VIPPRSRTCPDLALCDGAHVGPGKGLEDDEPADAVDEFRPEELPDRVADDLFGRGGCLRAEAEFRRRGGAGAEVAREDDHRLGEVDRLARGPRQAPGVEQLQQKVEDGVVGLLDLVEEDDRERLMPDPVEQPVRFQR